MREVRLPKAGEWGCHSEWDPATSVTRSSGTCTNWGEVKRDGNEHPFHAASLKTSQGLPANGWGKVGGRCLCHYFHTTFQLGRSHLCGFHTKQGSFSGRESISIFNHGHHTNSSSRRMRKLSHRLYLTSFRGVAKDKEEFFKSTTVLLSITRGLCL